MCHTGHVDPSCAVLPTRQPGRQESVRGWVCLGTIYAAWRWPSAWTAVPSRTLVFDRITPTSMAQLSKFQPWLSDLNLGVPRLPPCARRGRTQYRDHHHRVESDKRRRVILVSIYTTTTLKVPWSVLRDPSHLRVSIVHAQNAAHAASRTRESRWAPAPRCIPGCRLSRSYQPSRLRLSLVVGLPHWEIWYDFWPRPAYRAMPERGSKPCFFCPRPGTQVLVQPPPPHAPLGPLAGRRRGAERAEHTSGQTAHRPPPPLAAHAPRQQAHPGTCQRNTLRVPRETLKPAMPFCPILPSIPRLPWPPRPWFRLANLHNFRPATHSVPATMHPPARERRSSPQPVSP